VIDRRQNPGANPGRKGAAMRLVTRGDLDGLTSAVIVTSHEKVDDIVLIHPQDITDRRIKIGKDDILANLPYHPDCGKWFDHHLLTESNEKPPESFDGKYGLAPSAAQLVWEYYDKDARYTDLVQETNRLDAAQLTRSDVLEPEGWLLRGYTIDGRTGLGAYSDYFKKCVEWVKTLSLDEILAQPEVAQRIQRMRDEDQAFQKALREHSEVDGNVVFTDFRPFEQLPIGNRFLIYTLFPEVNVSLRVHWGPQKHFVVAAVGHSIFNRTCKTNVGELMSHYGGGGHRGAGTTPLAVEFAEDSIADIRRILRENG